MQTILYTKSRLRVKSNFRKIKTKFLERAVTEDVGQNLATLFDEQSKDFIKDDILKIRFSGTCFKADSDEILFVDQYQLPDIYQTAITDPSAIPLFDIARGESVQIRSVFAIETNKQTNESILFQSSSATKVLDNRRTLLLRNGSFHHLNESGFIIDSKLSAFFKNKCLFFRSYNMVKRFLDLTDYFHSATNPQINDILNQPLFACDNPAAVIELSDDWMRKRFTSIQSLGILDKINVKTTAKKAHEYGITLILDKKNGKDAIVISEDKNEIKQILRFLNEEYYTGELTGNRYLTNSQTLVENIQR